MNYYEKINSIQAKTNTHMLEPLSWSLLSLLGTMNGNKKQKWPRFISHEHLSLLWCSKGRQFCQSTYSYW